MSDETVVRSTCPDCGTVEVVATAVTVLVAATEADPVYRYTCPECGLTVQKPTSSRAVPLLRGAGAVVLAVPAEVNERMGCTAAPFGESDLADFARTLDAVDALAALVAAPPLRRPTRS